MIASKHINRIVAGIMAAAILLCLCAMLAAQQLTAVADGKVTMEYESRLFDHSQVLEINIRMEEADWQAMLDNALQEEYCSCDVEIGGTVLYHVGIRPKGNTSLTSIANDPTTDRYSFKLEFDHYVEGQTCFGLDKLVLNNNYADATNMKEALIYDMFQALGADASLYNYAKISVNGEYWGVYLALEAVEDSFLLRNYGVKNGHLYKPESLNMGDGGQMPMDSREDETAFWPMQIGEDGAQDFDPFSFGDAPTGNGDFMQMPAPGDGDAIPAEPPGDIPGDFDPFSAKNFPPEDRKQPGNATNPDDMDHRRQERSGDFAISGSGGADLNYTDDALDSYSAIWDGEITASGKSDHRRVIAALKNAAEGTGLESCLDTDNLLRYLAVHIFSVNDDSLSGMMAHNYYLYEYGGQLNLFPWDYNLAFGGMSGGDASSVVNSPIDDAFSITNFFDALLEDEVYHGQYYDNLGRLVEDYLNGGGLDAFYTRVRSQIDSLVESDPTAFYTYQEYEQAAEQLYQTVLLRGQSISGQLSGEIPSTESGQRADKSDLIDAEEISISVMGTMQMGGGQQAFRPEKMEANAPQSDSMVVPAEMPGRNGGQNGFPQQASGTVGSTVRLYGICLLVFMGALLLAALYRRKG